MHVQQVTRFPGLSHLFLGAKPKLVKDQEDAYRDILSMQLERSPKDFSMSDERRKKLHRLTKKREDIRHIADAHFFGAGEHFFSQPPHDKNVRIKLYPADRIFEGPPSDGFVQRTANYTPNPFGRKPIPEDFLKEFARFHTRVDQVLEIDYPRTLNFRNYRMPTDWESMVYSTNNSLFQFGVNHVYDLRNGWLQDSDRIVVRILSPSLMEGILFYCLGEHALRMCVGTGIISYFLMNEIQKRRHKIVGLPFKEASVYDFFTFIIHELFHIMVASVNLTKSEQNFMIEFFDIWKVLASPQSKALLELDEEREIENIRNRFEIITDMYTTNKDLQNIIKYYTCILGYFDLEEARSFSLGLSMAACSSLALARRRAKLINLLEASQALAAKFKGKPTVHTTFEERHEYLDSARKQVIELMKAQAA